MKDCRKCAYFRERLGECEIMYINSNEMFNEEIEKCKHGKDSFWCVICRYSDFDKREYIGRKAMKRVTLAK